MKQVLSILFLFISVPLWAASDIQSLKTPSGLKVWLVEDHTIPLLRWNCALRRSLDRPC